MPQDLADILDRLVARARQFYSLPAVAMQVLDLTSNPHIDAHALKRCIECDPALTAKVLRVVNSSLFGLSREVSDLNQALALLGIKPLKLLVLGFSLPAGLFSDVETRTLGWFWRHTLTKAVAAREISETAWSQLGDESFTAALLQDLGLMLLIQEVGRPYLDFLEKVLARGYDLAALEREALGFDHTMLTTRLLAHWGMPQAMVDCTRSDVEDRSGLTPTERRLTQILRLAELVARLVADDHPGVLNEVLATGQKEHGLSPEQIQALIDRLEEKVRQLADVLSLQLPDGLDYRDVLNRAHALLAEVATVAAADLAHQDQLRACIKSNAASLSDEAICLNTAILRLAQRPLEALAVPPAPRHAAAPPPPAMANHSRAPRLAVVETDPGLLGQLAASVAACRQVRCSLSLLLVEITQVEDLLVALGTDGYDELCQHLGRACYDIDHPSPICLPFRDSGFAIILQDCERQMAVRLGQQLIDRVRRFASPQQTGNRPAPALCVGAATVSLPPKNFPAADLFAGAERCLYGSRASGGGVVKSIEIY